MSELEKTVADILVKASNAAESAGKFAMEQLPDIAQQYVLYMAVQSALTAVVCLSVLIASGFAVRRQLQWIGAWQRENVYQDNERVFSLVPTSLVGIFGGGFLLITLISAAKTFVLATVAPKVLLIQWAATLVK